MLKVIVSIALIVLLLSMVTGFWQSERPEPNVHGAEVGRADAADSAYTASPQTRAAINRALDGYSLEMPATSRRNPLGATGVEYPDPERGSHSQASPKWWSQLHRWSLGIRAVANLATANINRRYIARATSLNPRDVVLDPARLEELDLLLANAREQIEVLERERLRLARDKASSLLQSGAHQPAERNGEGFHIVEVGEVLLGRGNSVIRVAETELAPPEELSEALAFLRTDMAGILVQWFHFSGCLTLDEQEQLISQLLD